MTTFVSVLDTRTWELRYANAGHHMPVILRNGTCGLISLHSSLPLAVMESVEYETHTADLQDASGLLLYTDGLVEARRRGELFGDDRLCELCGEEIGRSARHMLTTIEERVRSWSGILKDDIAMVIIKWGVTP